MTQFHTYISRIKRWSDGIIYPEGQRSASLSGSRSSAKKVHAIIQS